MEKPKTSKKEVLRKIVFYISLCVFLVAGFKLFTIVRDYMINASYYNDLRQYAPKLVQEGGQDTYKFSDGDFDTLYQMNSDFKAWIIVPGTGVNYPVMQGEDNNYYLEKSLNKTKLGGGSIFFASDIPNPLDAQNTVIHGHHMKNDSMFGSLRKYKKEDFLKENKYFYVVAKDKTYKYEIFSVYVAKVSTDPYTYRFSDDDQFIKYLNDMNNKSMFEVKISEFNKDDKMVTLSTCDYDFDDARLLIHGRLIQK